MVERMRQFGPIRIPDAKLALGLIPVVAVVAVAALGLASESRALSCAPSGCPPICAGNVASIVGTQGDDRLVGTRRSDVISARDGDDRVLGRGGNDVICGGRGADRLLGNAGDEGNPFEPVQPAPARGIFGNRGQDLLQGNRGSDALYGGRASDRVLFGGGGNDLLTGAKGPDGLAGGPGNDRQLGNDGPDGLNGDAGVDGCHGGPPENDSGGRSSGDVADREGCERITSARPGQIDFGFRPAYPE